MNENFIYEDIEVNSFIMLYTSFLLWRNSDIPNELSHVWQFRNISLYKHTAWL